MQEKYKIIFYENLILYIILPYSILALPQHPEINDQFEEPKVNNVEDIEVKSENITGTHNLTVEDNEIVKDNVSFRNITTEVEVVELQPTVLTKIYNILTNPMVNFIASPTVNTVLRNIGTCIVNGAMEIIAYYLPAPVMPLIASAAGMLIPFEPVVMLREKMPVNSYRRAIKKAVNSFMGTFQKYQFDDFEDPYMTQRFNRRFMNEKSENKAT